MKRRFFALFFLLCLIFARIVSTGAVESNGFSDAEDSGGYAEAIQWAAERGYINGYSDGRFGPGDSVTRAQLAAIFYRAAGSPDASGPARFSDVQETAYYRDAVSWAQSSGLTGGYADGRFGVNDPVTRQQTAAVLWRWAGSPDASGEDYADENAVAAYARTAVDWVRSNRILAGRQDGRFAPQDYATRAEVVSALYQYQNLSSFGNSPRILTAYFSATGTTEGIAEHIRSILGADLYEIVPEQPYTSADLNYNDASSRSSLEQGDDAARPAISGTVENMEQYDVVFLGYPIWHGQAPKILRTFLESCDFSGKTVIPFCTSHSSSLGSSADRLHGSAPNAVWMPGNRFSGGADRSAVEAWLNGLNLPGPMEQDRQTAAGNEVSQVQITAGGQTFAVTLLDHPAARAFRERLPLTVRMEELNGNEKYGSLPEPLPVDSQRPGEIQAGDLMLYGSDCLVLFYESFPSEYRYTRLGRVEHPSGLAAALGTGSVEVVFQRA